MDFSKTQKTKGMKGYNRLQKEASHNPGFKPNPSRHFRSTFSKILVFFEPYILVKLGFPTGFKVPRKPRPQALRCIPVVCRHSEPKRPKIPSPSTTTITITTSDDKSKSAPQVSDVEGLQVLAFWLPQREAHPVGSSLETIEKSCAHKLFCKNTHIYALYIT